MPKKSQCSCIWYRTLHLKICQFLSLKKDSDPEYVESRFQIWSRNNIIGTIILRICGMTAGVDRPGGCVQGGDCLGPEPPLRRKC
jgi:hypothetical protein